MPSGIPKFPEMHLKSVQLKNYRRLANFELRLQPGFNALVGVNGSGKSSILNAICEALGVAVTGLHVNLPADTARREIQRSNGRVYFTSHYPVELSVTGVFPEGEQVYGRFRTDNVSSWGVSGRLDPPWIGKSGVRPMVAYYRSSRCWQPVQAETLQAATSRPTPEDGYRQWQDASASASELQVWAISKCLERFQVSSATGVLFDDIHDDELALVNSALALALEDVRGLRYDIKEKSLLVERGHDLFPFEQLSDGEKVTIGLVADIARRMCLLNPMLGQKTIEQTEGVVMIDELDLHLHPAWQRKLTRGLKATFPKVQFIVATHSPQVLAELKPEEIILLRSEEGLIDRPRVSYGLDSSSVLEIIMGTSPHPPEIEIALKALFSQLESGDLEGARRILLRLRSEAPGLPELTRAEALLKRKQVLGR